MDGNDDTNLPALTEPTGTALSSQVMFDSVMFDRAERIAKIMASGRCTIPKHLQGQEGDCFAIVSQALRWGFDPYMVASKTHLVNGQLGYESQLIVAVLYNRAPIIGRLRIEFSGTGKDLTCTVTGFLKAEPNRPLVKEVRLGDQTIQNSPLWKTDPQQQLAYLAQKRWARLYCPDVILGAYSPDELEDEPVTPQERAEAAKDVTNPAGGKSRLDAFEEQPPVSAKGKPPPPPPPAALELVSEDGEIVQHNDPVAYAKALKEDLVAAGKKGSRMLELAWERHKDTVARLPDFKRGDLATRLEEQYREMHRRIVEAEEEADGGGEQTAGQGSVKIAVPQGEDGPDWLAFYADASARLDELSKPEEFQAFLDAHVEELEAMAKAERSYHKRLAGRIADGIKGAA